MQKIELSFCSDLGKHSRWIHPLTGTFATSEDIGTPPTEVNFDESDPEKSSTVPELPQYLSTPVAPSDSLHIKLGKHTVVDVVKHLELLLECKLNYNIHQVGDTTKVFLDMAQAPNSAMAESSSKLALPAASEVLDWGVFDVKLVRDPNTAPRSHDSMFITLAPKFHTPPTIIVGLNSAEADRTNVYTSNARIKTMVDNVREHIFCAHINSLPPSKLYRAGLNWLAMPSEHPHFQAGTFSTAEDDTWIAGNHATHRKIDFPHSYEIPPMIVVWLNNFDFCPAHHEHIFAFASDITTSGFTVHINSWGDSKLYGASVSWFAYPTGYPGICSGNLLPDKGTLGVVNFQRKFEKLPTGILVGLTKLQTDKSKRCSFNIITEAVSKIGMGIRVEPWGESILHSAGVAYIAIE